MTRRSMLPLNLLMNPSTMKFPCACAYVPYYPKVIAILKRKDDRMRVKPGTPEIRRILNTNEGYL